MSDIKIKQLENKVNDLEQTIEGMEILVRELLESNNILNEEAVEQHNRITKLEREKGGLHVVK